MARITVTLGVREQEALLQLALAEMRNCRDQARFIIRHELERRGLLPPADRDQQPDTTEPPSPEAVDA